MLQPSESIASSLRRAGDPHPLAPRRGPKDPPATGPSTATTLWGERTRARRRVRVPDRRSPIHTRLARRAPAGAWAAACSSRAACATRPPKARLPAPPAGKGRERRPRSARRPERPARHPPPRPPRRSAGPARPRRRRAEVRALLQLRLEVNVAVRVVVHAARRRLRRVVERDEDRRPLLVDRDPHDLREACLDEGGRSSTVGRPGASD